MNNGFYGFPNILGLLRATNIKVLGKAGATAGAGLAGGTTSGAPTSGAFDVGEAVIGADGTLFICTVTGSPGTWVQLGTLVDPLTTRGDILRRGASATQRLALGSANQVLQSDGTDAVWGASPAAGGGALTQIAQTILGSTAATITFSSIAGSYSTLLLTVVGKGTASSGAGGTGLNLQLNGDTAGNYDYVRSDNTGSSFDGSAAFSASSIALGYFNNASGSSAPTALSIVIYDYARTQWWKAVSATGMFAYQSSTPGIRWAADGGLWKSTAAVTSLLIGTSDGSFAAGTVATLYGCS